MLYLTRCIDLFFLEKSILRFFGLFCQLLYLLFYKPTNYILIKYDEFIGHNANDEIKNNNGLDEWFSLGQKRKQKNFVLNEHQLKNNLGDHTV